MSNFPISRFSIKFQALEDVQFPKYAGSTLRGAFGHALKNIACLTASQHSGVCQCQPATHCLYRQLFDPAAKLLKRQDRIQDIPPPFVIEANTLAEQIKQGETATFHMTLIGKMAHQQQVIIQLAWQRALAVGFGKYLSVGRPQAQLLSFQICDTPQIGAEATSEIEIELMSHARLQHYGQFLTPETFQAEHFCRAVFRRYLTLAEVYADMALDAAQVNLLYQQIAQVTGTAQLEWMSWSRWSNRQKQKMDLDGLMGKISLHNVSDELFNYLYLGQWLHAGKGCVFGLGHYQLR